MTALCCAGYFHEHVRCAAFDALPSVISATQSAFPAASGTPASPEHETLHDHAVGQGVSDCHHLLSPSVAWTWTIIFGSSSKREQPRRLQ